MFSLLGQAKRLVELEAIATDTWVFRLHYKLTCPLLVVATLLLGARQYFGDAIACYVHGIPDRIIDAYCWVHGTYTIEELVTPSRGRVAFQGVGPFDERMHHKIHHGFYQWVPLAMATSAICFALPRFIWKGFEKKRMQALVGNGHLAMLQPRPTKKANQSSDIAEQSMMDHDLMDGDDGSYKAQRLAVTRIVQLFGCLRRSGLRPHREYLLKFVMCEALNVANVVLQLMLTNLLLNGSFFSYGFEHFSYIARLMEESNEYHPGEKVFPRMAQCTFAKHGPSGNVQDLHALCILPHNILIEKIYLILWLWYIVLATISTAAFAIRMATLISKTLARWLVVAKSRLLGFDAEYAVRICESDQGDWFVMEQIGKNVDPIVFNDILVEVASFYNDTSCYNVDTLEMKYKGSDCNNNNNKADFCTHV